MQDLLVFRRSVQSLTIGLLLIGLFVLPARANCLAGLELLGALPHTAAFDQGTIMPPDLVRMSPGFGSQSVPGWPAGVGVMAFARRADGAVMLVPDRGFALGGQLYRRGQLLEVLNGQVSALAWIGQGAVVRAVDHHANRYFFGSIRVSQRISGLILPDLSGHGASCKVLFSRTNNTGVSPHDRLQAYRKAAQVQGFPVCRPGISAAQSA